MAYNIHLDTTFMFLNFTNFTNYNVEKPEMAGCANLDAILDFEKSLQGDFRELLICDFTYFSGPILKISFFYA